MLGFFMPIGLKQSFFNIYKETRIKIEILKNENLKNMSIQLKYTGVKVQPK